MAETIAADIADLNRRFADHGTRAMLTAFLQANAGRRIAVVSSFGAGSSVLLHMIAGIDPALPVLFVDTGKLFADTLVHRDEIASRLGLRDVRTVAAEPAAIAAADPHGALWLADKTACCALRKVAPFAEAIAGFDVWISGRKRHQGGERSQLPLFEADGPRLKINPLAHWTTGDIEVYRAAFGLPQHPLAAKGYRSIGCEPCTTPVADGEDERAGRWRGEAKTECGIHARFEDGSGI